MTTEERVEQIREWCEATADSYGISRDRWPAFVNEVGGKVCEAESRASRAEQALKEALSIQDDIGFYTHCDLKGRERVLAWIVQANRVFAEHVAPPTPPKTQQWIPVSEPAPDDFVLVLGKHELHGVNDPTYYRCGARSFGNGEFRDGFGNVLTRVIGWAPMPPLPTPPEEEKS